ncbi:hypothetical protein [Paenibacillus sp. FSL L8-0708]|uniref:hypothetical protein n=1 Tax=Paenibacillus sp. FSL L8-0708 TaxID=2975311 RepID=UPI0030F5D6D5
MNTIERVIDFSLKNYGKGSEKILELLAQEFGEETESLLRKVSLYSFDKRNNLYWKLQILCEKTIFENPQIENEDTLISLIKTEWNKLDEPQKLTMDLCANFLSLTKLKYNHARKAFIYICQGDLEGSKLFIPDQRILTELLIRYFVCFLEGENDIQILSLVDEVISWHYTVEETKPAQQYLLGAGFRLKKGKNGRMAAYKKIINVDGLCFAEGLEKIILESSKHCKPSELMKVFIDNLHGYSEQGITQTAKNLKIDKGITDSLPYSQTLIGNSDETIDLMGATSEEETVEKDLNQALSSIHRAMEKMKSGGNLLLTVLEEEYSNKLEIAEDELKRLNMALEQEKERVRQTEEKVLSNLLKALGGSRGDYLLSDLFEESQGIKPNNPNISTGRLVNLFSNLNLTIGLEEFSNFKEINEIFIVTRAELIKNYETNGPISSDSDEIKVKLLKYGWMLNNRIIIPPLVTEMKFKDGEEN